MSFNLNKNEGELPSKKSSFDLSKNEAGAPDNQPAVTTNAPKRTWLYALFALLIIAGAGWYFTRDTGNAKATADGQALTDSSAQQALAANDSITRSEAGKTEPEKMDPESGIASSAQPVTRPPTESAPAESTTRIAASFTAGSSHPGDMAGSLPALIRKKLKTDPRLTIHVLGYASSEGSPEINQQISQARADAYKRMLIQKGIAENNINAEGKGIDNPIAGNDTEAGRKKNRRVEVSW